MARSKKSKYKAVSEHDQSWHDTQPQNRVAWLRMLGASNAQIGQLVGRGYRALSRWARRGLKRTHSHRKQHKETIQEQLAGFVADRQGKWSPQS